MPSSATPQELPVWWEATKILFTAFLSVVLSGFWVSRWKAGLDHAEKRIDDLYDEIKVIADDATKYWTLNQRDNDVVILEAKISAGIMRIAQLRVLLTEIVAELDADPLISAEANFLREATGGDFGVHNRTASATRAASVQLAASALMVALRRMRVHSLRRRWFWPRV